MRTRLVRQFTFVFAFALLSSVFGGRVLAQEAGESMLIRGQGDDRIFIVAAGRKRPVANEVVLSSYGRAFSDVRDVDPGIVAAIPDVRVVKLADSPMIFDVTSGARVAVISPEDFLGRGYEWGEVATVSQKDLESYPPGSAAQPPAAAPAEEPPPAAPVPETPYTEPVVLQKIALARQMLHAAPPLYPQETRTSPPRALSSGNVGPDVQMVQEKLKELGFFPADVDASGVFGPATERSVKAFQKARGIEQVGRVGPQTLAALKKSGLALPPAGTLVKAWRDVVPGDREVLIAAWNQANDDLKPVRITLQWSGKAYNVITHTEGFEVRRKGGTGVNVQYAIVSPPGYQVLANRFPIFDAATDEIGSFPPSEEVYVPYGDELRTPEIVEAGRRYLDSVVAQALDDLKLKGVVSASGAGLVGDLADPDELKNIAIIEHLDYAEFKRTDDKHGVVNRILTVLGTNREDAYRFAGSSKGALGLAQFIQGSYHAIRGRYPAAALDPDFRSGMADHVNAFKAMALYHDMSSVTLEAQARAALQVGPEDFPAAMAEVRAAAYNGGTVRVKNALKKFGLEWQTAKNSSFGLFAETRSYLEKFKSVRQLLGAI